MPYAGIGDTTRRNLPDWEAMAAQYGTPSHERMWCAYEQDKGFGRNQNQAWVGGIPQNVFLQPGPSPLARGSNASMLSRLSQARQQVSIDDARREVDREVEASRQQAMRDREFAARERARRAALREDQPSTSSSTYNRPNFNVRNPFSDESLGWGNYRSRGGFGDRGFGGY